MFENSGDLVILALAVVVAFVIATVIAERRLAETLRREHTDDAETADIRPLLPAALATADPAAARIGEPNLRAIA